MAVSIEESGRAARSNTAAEPLAELLRRGDFEDVTRRRRAARRVWRRSSDGLSVYVRVDVGNSREFNRHRARYAVAYEGEDEAGTEVQYTILETDDPRGVLQLLDLLNLHAQRLRERIEARVSGEHLPGNLLEQCATFDDPNERESILRSLAQLAMKPVPEAAAQGFVQAVYSHVDDWITHRRGFDSDP